MKHVKVVASAIMKDGKLFVAQRPETKEVPFKWEFPGGKIEEGESPEEALKREIREELSTEIEIDKFIAKVSYTYPTFHLDMDVYLCHLTGPEPKLTEHINSAWLTESQMDEISWAPADYQILEDVKKACFPSA